MDAGQKLWLALLALLVGALAMCATAGTEDSSEGGVPTDDSTLPGDDGSGTDDGPTTDDGGGNCQCSPLPPNVMTSTCDAGACAVGSCSPGWYDTNGMYNDGCECQGMMNATTCAMATMVPALMLGGSTTVTGNLPAMMMDNWFQLSFGGNNLDKTYHPHVTLSTNPNTAFLFDVTSDCNGSTLACGAEMAADGSVGLTDWEEMYGPNSGDGGAKDGGYKPVPPVGGIYVRVYRATGNPTCDQYVLTISD